MVDRVEEVLRSLDVRLSSAIRSPVARGALRPIAAHAITLVYVAAGEIAEVSSASSGPRTLRAGDALLSLGRRPLLLESRSGAQLTTIALEPTDPTGALATLPDVITITGFGALEPAAAALAENMGQADPDACPLRTGDPVICRMMATTVLLSVIRAWAENGCAPEGWPSPAKDPFLDRVVEAIHDQPGREWTVELLAGVGAMSRTVFAERFRSALGRSPASYVTEVRMDAAKRMLDAGRPVSTVSRELGYASDEGFSRAFRRHTGMTPSAWRLSRRAPIPA